MGKSQDWVEKYRPRTLSGVVGHPSKIEELLSWGQSWKRGIPKDKAVLLYGRAGIGKTTAAYALAYDMKWDVIELNASDQRTAKTIEKIAGAASQMRSLDVGFPERDEAKEKESIRKGIRLIILDEADNLHGNADRGGEKAIIDLIKKTTQPIVLTANEYYDMSIVLRNACRPIQFSSIKIGTIIGILKKIAVAENVICGMGVIETIADHAQGDLRGAINDLQAIAEGKIREGGKIKIDINDVTTGTGIRDIKENIFKVLDKIFKGTDVIEAYRSSFDLDQNPEEFINWIDENLPFEYTRRPDLAKGYDYLSDASLFLGRVRRRQNYGMWRYAGFLMTAGINIAKSERYGGFTKFQTPTYWQQLGRSRGIRGVRDSAAKKIGRRIHVSSAYIKSEMFPFFKMLMKDERYTVPIAASLGLEKEEIAFIIGEDIKSDKVRKIYDEVKLIIEEETEHDIEIFGKFVKKTEKEKEKEKNKANLEQGVTDLEDKKIIEKEKISEKEKEESVGTQKSLTDFQKGVKDTDKFYEELFKLIMGGIVSSKKGEIGAPINAIIDEARKFGLDITVGKEKELIKNMENIFNSRNISTDITRDGKFIMFKKK